MFLPELLWSQDFSSVTLKHPGKNITSSLKARGCSWALSIGRQVSLREVAVRKIFCNSGCEQLFCGELLCDQAFPLALHMTDIWPCLHSVPWLYKGSQDGTPVVASSSVGTWVHTRQNSPSVLHMFVPWQCPFLPWDVDSVWHPLSEEPCFIAPEHLLNNISLICRKDNQQKAMQTDWDSGGRW